MAEHLGLVSRQRNGAADRYRNLSDARAHSTGHSGCDTCDAGDVPVDGGTGALCGASRFGEHPLHDRTSVGGPRGPVSACPRRSAQVASRVTEAPQEPLISHSNAAPSPSPLSAGDTWANPPFTSCLDVCEMDHVDKTKPCQTQSAIVPRAPGRGPFTGPEEPLQPLDIVWGPHSRPARPRRKAGCRHWGAGA